MKKDTFQQILERLRAEAASKAAVESIEAIPAYKEVSSINIPGVASNPTTDEEIEDAKDAIREVISQPTNFSLSTCQTSTTAENKQDKAGLPEPESSSTPVDKTGVARDVELNTKQQEFSDLVISGEDCILVGAAGTGKTTNMRKTSRRLIDSGRIPNISEETKWLKAGLPGAAILSYTRKAVNNIRHAVVDELKPHTLTVHKLLEFQPEFFEIYDEAAGDMKKTMNFIPARNSSNPLPRSLKFLAFEESSMIPVDLYELLEDAMPHKHQEIFLGDIQQLPPTFGAGILGFKMLQLPIVELTEVYRQARESPIIDLAWKILAGNPHIFDSTPEFFWTENAKGEKVQRKRIPALEALSQVKFSETGEYIGTLKFQPWQKQLEDYQGTMTCIAQFKAWEKEGYYLPETDIILCPYNKAFGCDELNKGIQQYLGEKRGAVVHEVIAGWQKHYLAEGDRVLYDKEDAVIVSITRNVNYTGAVPAPASQNLDRWGTYRDKLSEQEKLEARASQELSEDGLDDFLELSLTDVQDRVQEASHDVVIRYAYSDEEQCLSKAAEINNLLGGNAMTVHKFQGSEAERVFIVLHHSHAKMVSRELLYTAVTRAKTFLHIICEPKSFFTGVASQRIKGNTLAEKALQFTGLKEKREQEKVAKELEEHRKLRESLDSYETEEADRQQEELKKTDISTEALDALMKAAPKMDNWVFDLSTGKMILKKQEILKSLPDIQSDPLETLEEPNLGYWLPSETKEASREKTTQEIIAERLARIRAKKGA